MSFVEMEEGYRLEMAELIKQENEFKAKLAIIEQKLAGPEEKLEKAKAILLKAKAAYEQILGEVQPLRSDRTLIEGELTLLREKKSELKHQAALARGGAGMRPGTQAFVEQMNELVGPPEDLQLKKEVKTQDAAQALEELKKRMGQS